MYGVNSFKHSHLKEIVGFLHAFTGCDTTSAFYKMGKIKLTEVIYANPELLDVAKKIYINNADNKEIGEAACKIIAKMYGDSSGKMSG